MSEVHLITQPPRRFVGVRREVPVTELQPYFAEVLPRVMIWLSEQGIPPASMPMAMWHHMDRETGVADVQAGCFVAEAVAGEGEIAPASTPGGELLHIVHVGSYLEMGRSWMQIYAKAAELKRETGPGWEIYVDDPSEVAEAELRTEIYLPLR